MNPLLRLTVVGTTVGHLMLQMDVAPYIQVVLLGNRIMGHRTRVLSNSQPCILYTAYATQTLSKTSYRSYRPCWFTLYCYPEWAFGDACTYVYNVHADIYLYITMYQ